MNKKIGVCSECGDFRVHDAPCRNCGEEGKTWEMM